VIETHWSERVAACERAGTPCVIVTVLGARGSTPRDAGTKMVVEPGVFTGTIGGGELEFRALARARELLGDAANGQRVEHFPLGEKLGQCCGGSVSLLFEVCVPDHLPVYLFGAGHVGRALAPILAALPLRLTWIDERADAFPPAVPEGVAVARDVDPVGIVATAPAGTAFVIMTHNHPLDYALAEAALRRSDAGFVGVIGSGSKARRFRLRLAHRGLPQARIDDLACPIGLAGVPGKQPAEIAVAVAGQLIAHYHASRPERPRNRGPGWKELRAHLDEGVVEPAASAPRDGAGTPRDRSPTE
jgi:xanthine dehydrogenase accessory factor